MVLMADNFASIEAAVEEGRGVLDNLTKFIVWILPTNLGVRRTSFSPLLRTCFPIRSSSPTRFPGMLRRTKISTASRAGQRPFGTCVSGTAK